MVIFDGRREAGSILAGELSPLKAKLKDPIVLGIPRGGVPVGFSVAEALGCPLDVIALRKLPIPDSPEAGFGAVTLDKIAILNEKFLSQIYLSKPQIDSIIDTVYREVLRRNRVYRRKRPFPQLKGRSVILTDDGLATGYTMLAAVEFTKSKGAEEVIVAVPVAHHDAYNMVKQKADKMVALHISELPFFAVAQFYKEFTDMSDEEVISYLDKGEVS